MKQTLKIGDKYRVIKTNKIITVEEIFNRHSFYGSDNNWHNLELGELQLIKPKTKKVKKYRYSRKEIVKMIKTKCFFGHNESKAVRWLLATQPQPVKEESKCDCWRQLDKESMKGKHGDYCSSSKQEESKDIEKLELFFNEDEDCYEINEMRHSDSRIDLLAGKLNELIDTLNSLTKRNIK